MALYKKLSARRKKRKAEDKWVLGEKLTKVGRERGRRRRTLKKVEKVFKAGGAIKTVKPKRVDKPEGTFKSIKETLTPAHKAALGKKQKIRKGAKGVELTKGGAYAKYEKKSKAARSFRAAFKKGCGASESGSFTWDGRSYSCKRAAPTKKQKAERKASMLPGGKKPTSYT